MFWLLLQLLFIVLSRLHSAGHLLDVCMQHVGLGDLKSGKGYHFPQGYDFVLLIVYRRD